MSNQINPLPTGLVVVRSGSPIANTAGIMVACAITRTSDSSAFYASDTEFNPGEEPMSGCVHWGPSPSVEAARHDCGQEALNEMDANGTDGSSSWLVLP